MVKSFLQYLLSAVGQPIILCVLGSHLLINLKEAVEKGYNGGASYRFGSVSNIDFDMSESHDLNSLGEHARLFAF